jgi:hypothetical protein
MAKVSFHEQLLAKIESDVVESLQTNTEPSTSYSKDEIFRTVFANYRLVSGSPTGLRLTSFGNKILSKHFTFYKYSIQDEINNFVFITLDKNMRWPYYLGTRNNHIVFYSEEDAAWFRLNGNSIKRYVESI